MGKGDIFKRVEGRKSYETEYALWNCKRGAGLWISQYICGMGQ